MAKKMLLPLLTLLMIGIGFSQLYGDIYEGDKLTRLDNVLIKISGTNSMQFLTNKTYSINLSEGNYTIRATHFREGKIDYITEDQVSFDGSSKKFDIVLIPNELFELTPKQNNTTNQTSEIPREDLGIKIENLIIAGVGSLILVAIFLFAYGRRKKPSDAPKTELPPLKHEEKEVLRIIGENNGKMYQKELREILNYSEAKMSILIGELEKRGEISREKIGRDKLLKIRER